MDITTEIDVKANLRIHKVTGDVTVKSIMAKLEQVYSEPDFDPEMNVLWDMREAKMSSVSSSDVEQLSNFVAGRWGTGGRSRAALVVSRDFEFGISRMYEIFLESRSATQVQVFRDFDEALLWIKS